MPVRPAQLLAIAAALVPAVAAAQTRPSTTQPAAAAADVPVREVVLFSSGVGYFEHFGTVHGDASAELRFKARQINDVLKSLVLQDLDNGSVRAVTYASQDPIGKTLKSFQVNITANPPLAELLNQLRGATVTITVGPDELTGTVLGVEAKTAVVHDAKDGDRVVDRHVLNLVRHGRIVSKSLDDVSAVQLDDPQLQAELDKALAALAGARDADKKPVTIRFAGTGDRRVRMGYVVETPVWKTSYRLVLGPPAGGATTKPTDGQLQGWAIVENQTDNDWADVQLKLVSGRPISFVEDLYQPLYVPRPVVEPDLFASLRPPRYAVGQNYVSDLTPTTQPADGPAEPGSAENGVTVDQLQRRMAARREAIQGQQNQNNVFQNAGGGGGQGGGDANAPMDPTASVRSLASAANAGELFEYTVGSVSLARQRSAMIPIVTDPVAVERVSIYNQSVLPRNPLTGAKVRNTTKKLLLAGPITVLDGASYAGDAQVDDVPAGQERLLSYGVDLQMLVDAADDEPHDEVVTGRIAKGVLVVTHRTRASKLYAAQNKSDHDKVLIIEHPRQGGDWKLVDSPKPTERTDALYRFQTSVPAGRSAAVRVAEEQTTEQEVQLLGERSGDELAGYRRSGAIPGPVQEALAKAIALKQATVDTQRQIDAGKQRLADITAEQARLRDDLRAVERGTKYYDRLTAKLNAQEDQVEKTQGDLDGLQKQLDGQRKELQAYVAGLNV